MWKPGGSNPFSTISIVIATYWLTVFHFASRDAGTMTPTEAATARSPDTASSRPTITTTTQASILRSEEHTSELQSQSNLVCRLLLEKKKTNKARERVSQCTQQ